MPPMPSSYVYSLPPGKNSAKELKTKNDMKKEPKYEFTFKTHFINLFSLYT